MTNIKVSELDKLDELMKECGVDESDDDEEQIDRNLRLLSPTSSWSVMVDIKAIARLSKKSSVCGHNLQLLNFTSCRISFTCIICKPIEDKISEDEEIDKLLMESPVKGNSSLDTREENPPVSAMPNTEYNSKDVESEQSQPSSSQSRPLTPVLRLKPFRELQPLVPGLPQYTSRKMEDGVNPMKNMKNTRKTTFWRKSPSMSCLQLVLIQFQPQLLEFPISSNKCSKDRLPPPPTRAIPDSK